MATIEPPAPLTADSPVFTGPIRQGYPSRGVETGYVAGGIDSRRTLMELASSLSQARKPVVPTGTNATFVAALGKDSFVYRLWNGATPAQPHTYVLESQEETWTATPICQSTDQWVWSNGSEQTGSPIVVCGATEGSVGTLTVAVYGSGGELFLASGLLRGGLEIRASGGADYPDLIFYRALHWYRNYHEPPVFERVTVGWRGSSYQVTHVERREDWAYHIGRFLAFVESGHFDLAEREMQIPPPGGLRTYLAENAPALLQTAPTAWLQVWRVSGAVVFLSQGNDGAQPTPDWLRVNVSSDGRLLDIRQQAAPSN